uniref:Uncharacterized protein n=1 Tax=Zea mays TaxID=4577 RepID=B4FW19_MAIZE|nr:unknown [Zea mays]
MNCSADVL